MKYKSKTNKKELTMINTIKTAVIISIFSSTVYISDIHASEYPLGKVHTELNDREIKSVKILNIFAAMITETSCFIIFKMTKSILDFVLWNNFTFFCFF